MRIINFKYKKITFRAIIIILPILFLLIFFNSDSDNNISSDLDSKQIETFNLGTTKFATKVGDDKFQIYQNGTWEDITIKGVNMGIAKPGSFPGEVAITKDEYRRWFEYIGEMNANAIRVYTLHPPEFYEAFYEYNMQADEPLYLFHGVWINEENLLDNQDAFSDINSESFKSSIADTIDVIHGNKYIEKQPGHAGGRYVADISPYVIGFIIGVEWDPYVVNNTNILYPNKEQFNGEYISSRNGSPFEIWLAEMMNYTIDYEMQNYNWQRPISFTNWVTTDLLEHPSEPSEKEDLVSVDPNNIISSSNHYAGLFASYHVYPYYPDFLNYDPEYYNYVDADRQKNNYAGYLNDLKKNHDMPILVAEFGVPSSRGLTHLNIYGMNQGMHTEKEQGNIDSKLFKNIIDEGFAGGLVFTWQDEWFKRTWNTMDYDNPDRRPFWSNVQTNEQHFGLLSFEPGVTQKIRIDGEKNDWIDNGIVGLYENSNKGIINNFYATSDEAYIYFMIELADDIEISSWDDFSFLIYLDTIEQQGNESLPELENIKLDFGIDFVIQINGQDNSRVLVDSYYDPFYYQYGYQLKMIPYLEYASKKNNGIYHNINLALNKELYIPNQDKYIPFNSYETGKLTFGISDPHKESYNSLSDFYYDQENNVIELRIPWALLNIKDPSQKEIMDDLWETGLTGSNFIQGIKLGVVMYDNQKESILDSLPEIENDLLEKERLAFYQWPNWEVPTYHERLKESYYIMKDTFAEYQ